MLRCIVAAFHVFSCFRLEHIDLTLRYLNPHEA